VPDPAPPVEFAAVLVMAGSGSRLAADVPKAFVALGGKPMWRHAADTFASMDSCRALVLVAPADRLADVQAMWKKDDRLLVRVVAGGARRQDSVRLGLAAVPPDVAVVAIHDAARPFVDAATIESAVAEAARTGAALVAVPVRDTIKRVSGGSVAETLDRSALWQAQTPQCFRLDLVRRAHEAALTSGWEVTDYCALLERLGHAVAVVQGAAFNFKITDPDDLAAAEALLARRGRSGKEKRT
jgi:2-C-methyl-D-erythritol 4-phosphate cytidylyltransferase